MTLNTFKCNYLTLLHFKILRYNLSSCEITSTYEQWFSICRQVSFKIKYCQNLKTFVVFRNTCSYNVKSMCYYCADRLTHGQSPVKTIPCFADPPVYPQSIDGLWVLGAPRVYIHVYSSLGAPGNKQQRI